MMIAVITIELVIVLFLCTYIGFKHKQGCKSIKSTKAKKEQDLEELRQLQLREEGFKNIMNYDYNVAIGKR